VLPVEKALKIIRALGFAHVDVGFSHLDIDASLSSAEQGKAFKKRLKSAELTLSDLFPQLPFETNDPNRRHREQNKRTFGQIVGFAVECESPGITLKPGIRQPMREAERWAICLDVLGDFYSLASRAGLRLCVEPHVDSIIEEPKRARELVNCIDGLRITLDYSHFVARGYAFEDVKALHPYAGHFHVRQARQGRVQSSAATGVIPLLRILNDLAGGGYSGVISLEYQNSEWKNCNDIDVITETVAILRELGVQM
jgi:sugar phosphate isomerase/epimerase